MKRFLISAAVLSLALVASAPPAVAQNAEVKVTILRVKSIEGGDVLSKPDFFAKVTIADEVFTSPHIQDNDDISPDWTFNKSAPVGITGLVPIVMAIFDKDVAKDDPVDVSPRPDKRELNLTLDAIACTITGDVLGVCRVSITTSGNVNVKPRAELTFSVDVRRP